VTRKLDWDRKGPPRPSSGLGGHPINFERPFVHHTGDDEARRRRELAEEMQATGFVRKSAEWKARFGRPYPLSDEDKKLIKKHWGEQYVD
jgi:hypothetical protein